MIAEQFARDFDYVRAICAQPNYSVRGVNTCKREKYNDVNIFKSAALRLIKDNILFKLINFIFISTTMFFSCRRRKKRDCTLVVTNPPILTFLVLLASRIKGEKCIVMYRRKRIKSRLAQTSGCPEDFY